MPSPTVTIVDTNNNIIKAEEYAYRSWFDLEDGQYALIKAGLSIADIDKYNFTDKNGKKLSLSDIKWEISTESDVNGKDIWSNYKNVTNGEIKTNQSGKYRAKITYNGVTYYSPFEVLIKGIFYGKNQQAVLSGPSNGVKKFKDGKEIKIVLNEDAYWNTNGYNITKIELQLKSKPKGASTVYTKIDNEWGIFDPDSFFGSSAKEEDIVPGEYVFVGTVEGTKPDGTYKVKTAEYTLIYTKEPTDIVISASGETVYTPGKTKVPYFFPWDRTTVQFSSSVWPADATPTSWAKNVPVWKSSDTSALQIDPGTGVATIKKPGKVTVTVEYRGADKTQSQSIDVYIPIIGYEMEPTDFSNFVGKNYSEVTGKIRSVWCLGGEKITTNTDKYLKAEVIGHSDATGVSFANYKVAYDNDGRVTWKISPVGDNILPLDKVYTSSKSYYDEICYYVATYRIECNGVGNYDSINYVKAYGGTMGTTNSNEYIHRIYTSEEKFEEINKNRMYFCLTEVPEISNPNAEYIDTINITVKEPTVGDSRYEGSYTNGYFEYMVMNVAGTAGELKYTPSSYCYSLISKITTLKGSGEPYTNASAEGTLTEYIDVWNYEGGDYKKPLKPTKKYENGIYVNNVRLDFDNSLGNGKEYRIARDVKVYINGHLIDFAGVGYGKHQSKVTDSYVLFSYYFTVGEVETVSEVKLSGFAEDVKQGDMPISIDDLKVLVDGKEREDIYISSFVWYDDVNHNGEYDVNVDSVCNSSSYTKPYTTGSVQFAPDGSFLAGKSYKLHLEIASTGKVKFAENFKISFAEELNYGNQLTYSGQVIDLTFKPYQIIYSFNAETVDNLKASGDKFKYQPKNEQFGFSCTSKSVINKQNEDVINSELPNSEYIYRAVYTAADGYNFNKSCETKFLVNGKSITKGEFKTENGSAIPTGVTVSGDGKTLTVCYPFKVTDSVDTTATVGGTITSSGNASDKITVQLIKNGEQKASYETSVTGNSVKFSIANVKYGTYTLRVTKNGHETYQQSVSVNKTSVTQNVTLKFINTPVTGTTATVGGTITSSGNDSDKITVQLIKNGEQKASYETSVTGNSVKFSIANVKYGTYTLRITKNIHLTYEQKITIDKDNVTQNVVLIHVCDNNKDGIVTEHTWNNWIYTKGSRKVTRDCSVCHETETRFIALVGDSNGDGKLTAADARIALRAAVRLEPITDALLETSDINRDGAITASDARSILRAAVKLEILCSD